MIDSLRLDSLRASLSRMTLHWSPYPYLDGIGAQNYCAICEKKFHQIHAGTLKDGYTTEDNEHWICAGCFAGYREEFQWKVSG